MHHADAWPPPEGDAYDRLAPWYDEDMGASMRFDDIGFYRSISTGRVLELGCGTGRILRPLRESGIDIAGIDRSGESLRRLRERLGNDDCPLAQADIARDAPPAWPPFDTVLLPYSIITYWTNDDELAHAWAFMSALCKPGGRLVIDAFLPRPLSTQSGDFNLDYRRHTARGELSRWKRITALGNGCNRIERRYQIIAQGHTERFQTVEVIHPWHPEEIDAMAQRAGFQLQQRVYDYGASSSAGTAQFACAVYVRG
jgi:SAM-dependent methyltransferase